MKHSGLYNSFLNTDFRHNHLWPWLLSIHSLLVSLILIGWEAVSAYQETVIARKQMQNMHVTGVFTGRHMLCIP